MTGEGAGEFSPLLLGPDHPDVARTLSNLAKAFQKTGAYPEARGLYEPIRGYLASGRLSEDLQQDRADRALPQGMDPRRRWQDAGER